MSGCYSQDLEDNHHERKLDEYLKEEYPDDEESEEWRNDIEEGKPSIDNDE
jgi:hypothetical protein